MLSFNMKKRALATSVDDASIIFGAKDGQADATPEPFSLLTVWAYMQSKMSGLFAAASHGHPTSAIIGLDAALAVKESAGVAASGDATHVGAADPHTQYLNNVRGDARYAALAHTHPPAAGGDYPVSVGKMWERPPANSLNNVNWRHIVNQNPFMDGSGVGGENYANEVTAIGWNLSDTIGNPATAGTPAIWDNWEYKYNIGGHYNHERHMEFVDTAGLRHRYFSAALRHDGSYDQGGFWFDNFQLSNRQGVPKFQFELNNNVVYVGSATTGVGLSFNKNNVAPIQQRNSANSAFLSLPYFNSSDQLAVNGQVLHNATAPGSGGVGWSMNWSGTPGNGSTFFASSCGVDAGNATLTAMQFDATCNWDVISVVRNMKSGQQYSSAVQNAQTNSANGMAYLRCGYTAGQQWSIGMRNTQDFVLSAASNLLSSQVFSVNKANLNIAFDKPPKLPSYTVAGVPSAATYGAGSLIYVSNESGGACVAFSDGTNWRRVTDRAAIS